MAPAQEVIASASAAVPRMLRHLPQVESATGAVLAEDEAPDLAAQLVDPPDWRAILEAFLRHGVTDIAVLPPARTIRNVLHDTLVAIELHTVESDGDLLKIIRALAPETKDTKEAKTG